jgi:hypothetical protein
VGNAPFAVPFGGTGAPLALTSSAAGILDLVVNVLQGNQFVLAQYRWNGSSWGATGQVARCGAGGGLTAVSSQEDAIDLYVAGFSDHVLYHRQYSDSPSRAGGLDYCDSYCGGGGMPACSGACFGGSNAVDGNLSWNEPLQDIGGKCELCGGRGEPCCAGNACTEPGYSCDGNRQCNRTPAPVPPPSCTPKDQEGSPCCNGKCAGSRTCSGGNQCVSDKSGGQKTCSGSAFNSATREYLVGVEQPLTRCAQAVVPVWANSIGEAQQCVQAIYPGFLIVTSGSVVTGSGNLLSPITGECDTVYAQAFSDADLQICIQSQCVNCSRC